MVAKSGAMAAAAVGAVLMLCMVGVGADEIDDRWAQQAQEARTLEAMVLQKFVGSLSREGGVMTIIADNGVVVELSDRELCGFMAYYLVMDYIESISSFLVLKMASSDCSNHYLVHKRTGDVIRVGDEPEIDPDNRQFVTINPGPSENGGILIGRETDTGLVIEAVAGITGYEFAGWIDADRIALRYVSWMDHYLSKNEQEERGFGDGISRVAELVRQGGVWRLVEIISTPLAPPGQNDDAE